MIIADFDLWKLPTVKKVFFNTTLYMCIICSVSLIESEHFFIILNNPLTCQDPCESIFQF